MAAADTARLIASLELKDKFTGPSNKVLGSLDRLEGGFNRINDLASQGARNAAANIGKIGVVTAVGIAGAVKIGLDNLAQLESAVTSVDGAIAQMGLTGQITGKQVADWANQIERDVGAAFDDKEITAAAATLLRFGKVTPKNLKPALTVLTDLAVKTGDVDSAASLLAKALADPEKAAGKLARVGIILTKAQQDQIKAMVEAGDAAGAQALILDELAKSTEGAAKASQGPYQRALSLLKDITEDATKALATGFVPVIEKAADLLSKELAKPQTLANIQKFGEGLARGLDNLISVAQRLPWQQIGDSLKLGASAATSILDVFTSMPAWVQTAVITGWGLNKLTGGALGGIISELGKGLVKGVLGINAGVVQVNAKTVVGAGGTAPAPGGGAAVGSGRVAGLINGAFKVFMVGAAAAVIAELAAARGEQSAANQAQAKGVENQAKVFVEGANIEDLKKNLAGLRERQAFLTNNLTPEAIAYQLDIDGVNTTMKRVIATLQAQITTLESQDATRQNISNERLEALRTGLGQSKSETIANANAAAARQYAATQEAKASNASAQASIKAATDAAAAASARAGQVAAAAIKDKDLSVTVENHNRITTNVSVRETIDGQTTFKQYSRFLS